MLYQHFFDRLYNDGERLIPFVSHDEAEMRRHFSSYLFFMDVVRRDAVLLGLKDINILEIGFGSGFGSFLLATLPQVRHIVAVDCCPECREYAELFYSSEKIEYKIDDARRLPDDKTVYDYVISRGVLEHIPDGLSLPFRLHPRRRILINVPYRENEGNPHHCYCNIDESSFSEQPISEFLYETLHGEILPFPPEGRANMIFAVSSASEMTMVRDCLEFPRPPASLAHVQDLLATAGLLCIHHESPLELLETVTRDIEHTEVVLDIGPGIMPMNFFRPKLHMLLEPCETYAKILTQRYADDKSMLILHGSAQAVLPVMADNSVDSIVLMDVLEHIPKDEGRKILQQAQRLARRQIIVFTPLGYMAQHVEEGQKDGFGLDGHVFQEHRSGWLPEDFGPEWKFRICPTFHRQDFHGNPLGEPRGAFFAIRTFYEKELASFPEEMPDLRPVLPKQKALEDALAKARGDIEAVRAQYLERYAVLESMNSAFGKIMCLWSEKISGRQRQGHRIPTYFTAPLHVGYPNMGDRSIFEDSIKRILDSRWYTNNGVYVQEFERQICCRWGVKNAVAVTNGTLALMLACRALDLRGEVIMPALTFPGTAHALRWQGLTPVFVDVEPQTGLLSPEAAKAAITSNTTAILGVHLWGRPCAVDDLQALADRHGLPLFYDASHAADCAVNGLFVGNFGRCECFSLHATNVLHSFEGGLITTDDAGLARKLRLLRNFGISGEDRYEGVGINAKMTESCAAMGLANLEKLDELMAENRSIYTAYVSGLRGIPGIEPLLYEDGDQRYNFHYFVIRVLPQFGISRDMLHIWLKGHNVLARRQYWPGCHRLEPYAERCMTLSLPHADGLCAQCLALPCGPQVERGYVEEVCRLIRHVSFPELESGVLE